MISPAGTTAVELDRRLTFGSDSYPFTVCAGPGAWDDLARRFEALGATTDRFVFVVDTGVPRAAREAVLGCFPEFVPGTGCEVTPGEGNKTIHAAIRVMDSAYDDGVSRNSVGVA